MNQWPSPHLKLIKSDRNIVFGAWAKTHDFILNGEHLFRPGLNSPQEVRHGQLMLVVSLDYVRRFHVEFIYLWMQILQWLPEEPMFHNFDSIHTKEISRNGIFQLQIVDWPLPTYSWMSWRLVTNYSYHAETCTYGRGISFAQVKTYRFQK